MHKVSYFIVLKLLPVSMIPHLYFLYISYSVLEFVNSPVNPVCPSRRLSSFAVTINMNSELNNNVVLNNDDYTSI